MSLITNRNRSNNAASNTKADKAGEYDHLNGVYINTFMEREVETEDGSTVVSRVKLPLGIDITRLRDRAVWANQTPEQQAETQMLNQMLRSIRNAAEKMEEGDTIDLKLGVEMYKRQEAITEDGKPDTSIVDAVEDALFA